MKKLLILCFLAFTVNAFAAPQDSIGVKIIDGKTYIMHKVTKGEGVYGISKKYGVPSSEVFAANPGSEQSIKIGQVLLIPKAVSAGSSGTGNAKSGSTTKTEKIYHTVESGQTLSSIARQYNTSVANIKSMNNLSSDNIKLGQKLVVGEKTVTVNTPKPTPSETPATQPKTPDPVVEEPKSEPKPVIQTTPPPTSNNVVVAPKVNDKPMDDKPGEVVSSYSTDDGDEINETGIAVISSEGELSQEKIGTIVMITNPSNNSTVFARVVGNCKAENGIILKMSKTVATKLGVSDSSQVKLSYAK
jgi:LysM repeat protein